MSLHLEIIHGPESYAPENYRCEDPACQAHGRTRPQLVPRPRPRTEPQALAAEESIPESRGEYAEVYSSKHERILLRVDHITKMDAIRRGFNASRLYAGQRALTTSDIVNAVLDFAFEHRVPYSELQAADELKELISKSVYRSVLSRWRQFNERFD